ncbi:unnamed protein product [Merluccius merluccius]
MILWSIVEYLTNISLRVSLPFAGVTPVLWCGLSLCCFKVESPANGDFDLLRRMFVTSHMQDLKDVTHDTH